MEEIYFRDSLRFVGTTKDPLSHLLFTKEAWDAREGESHVARLERVKNYLRKLPKYMRIEIIELRRKHLNIEDVGKQLNNFKYYKLQYGKPSYL